ncbi:cyclic nucleotide-binding domain-containing protein [uncultured Methylibium sp.]|uniref:cyclic nucleotide-binding domain-containing protein n=1 Tax=uncultured Methylibium sp. TaxID=381093 RepID=UPI0025CC5D1F|nr:cyclic nucleotide-binding domain-containing protein [uncultured Methylibium sp.]
MTHEELLQAIQSLNAEDAFRPRLDPSQWRTFLQYLTRHEVRSGDLLLKQGDMDRTLYFLGQGTLQVYATGGAPGSNKIAILRAGGMCGEPGLFADGERTANVEAMTPCVVWALRLPRFEELCARAPVIALEVLRAAGTVMALRMRANISRQLPIT